MDSSGFSSRRFPAGLRVLVVDDDSTWLKILEKMLKKCNYEVTTCTLTQEALELLHRNKGAFDIVISDVNMPDMDGFKLLEHVGLTMDLPVIIMSVDGETSRVMKGVQHGACDYLLKPIRMKELQNIWQHVFRKRLNEVKDIECQEIEIQTQTTRKENVIEQKSDGLISGKKRKEVENKNHGGNGGSGGPSSPVKKSRLIWTVDLHQKFVKAVNQIGFDKVGPKKILDLMGDPQLTRENVASHLQKYRLYLSRLDKEKEQKTANVVSSKLLTRNACFQNSTTRKPLTVQQNMVTNENYAPISSNSRITFNPSYAPSDSEVNPWKDNVLSIQFEEEEFRPHFQHHLPLLRPSTVESNINPSYDIGLGAKVENTTDLFFGEPALQQIPCSMWCTNTNGLEHDMYYNLESSMRNLTVAYPPPEVDIYRLNHHDLASFESFGYNNQGLVADFPPSLYDSTNFDPSDFVEYHVIDQDLFIS